MNKPRRSSKLNEHLMKETKKLLVKKGEIIEDVYYTMEKYSYLMADIDLSMSMRLERSAAYIAGA